MHSELQALMVLGLQTLAGYVERWPAAWAL